ESDGLFSEGWRRAAAEAAADRSRLVAAAASMDEEKQRLYQEAADKNRSLGAHLMERETRSRHVPALPATISVGSVMDYAQCPKRFYWSTVRPLPRFSGPAARIGTRIHAWIERQSSGQTSLIDLDEAPDLTLEELARQPGKMERLQRTFQRSRFADRVSLYA